MSESGHSQPGMYGQGRRRRRRRDREPGPPGQNLSGPSRDRDFGPRERRVGFVFVLGESGITAECYIKYAIRWFLARCFRMGAKIHLVHFSRKLLLFWPNHQGKGWVCRKPGSGIIDHSLLILLITDDFTLFLVHVLVFITVSALSCSGSWIQIEYWEYWVWFSDSLQASMCTHPFTHSFRGA